MFMSFPVEKANQIQIRVAQAAGHRCTMSENVNEVIRCFHRWDYSGGAQARQEQRRTPSALAASV